MQHPSKAEITEFARERREEVISTQPFRVRRVARWSECDPAGVVYVGNFAEYMLSAVHLFRRQVFDAGWAEMRDQFQIDTPGKALSMVFKGSLWPDDVFDVEVRVGEIRTRTFDFQTLARRALDGTHVFEGKLSAICVSAQDRRISMRIPDPLRHRLQAAQPSI